MKFQTGAQKLHLFARLTLNVNLQWTLLIRPPSSDHTNLTILTGWPYVTVEGQISCLVSVQYKDKLKINITEF